MGGRASEGQLGWGVWDVWKIKEATSILETKSEALSCCPSPAILRVHHLTSLNRSFLIWKMLLPL